MHEPLSAAHVLRALALRALALRALIPCALAVTGCRTDPPPDPALLPDLVERTWPRHGDYELTHQLLVRSEDPAVVMDLLDLAPGMVVADIGAGAGFYTFRLAEAVGPSGRVWAVDLQESATEYLRRRVADPRQDPHGVIRVVRNRADDLTLPPESLDAALFAHADFYAFPALLDENRRMLESCRAALKPGGALVVVQDLRVHEAAAAEHLEANLVRAGFVVDQRRIEKGGAEAYVRFRRP